MGRRKKNRNKSATQTSMLAMQQVNNGNALLKEEEISNSETSGNNDNKENLIMSSKDSVDSAVEKSELTDIIDGGNNRDYHSEPLGARIKVIGIGGGGGNAVNNMINLGLKGS
jgi:hypothetical protein